MEEFNILVPSEIPPDETVLVIAVHFANGIEVAEDMPIFEIETSKTAYVLTSNVSGRVNHQISVGDEVKSGQIIGVVLSEK